MKASKVLLSTKAGQTNSILACKDGKMCASGVLLRRMGFNKQDLEGEGYYPDSFLQEVNREPADPTSWNRIETRNNWFYSMVGSFYDGITEEIWKSIVARNDSGWSFKKIGKWLQDQGF